VEKFDQKFEVNSSVDESVNVSGVSSGQIVEKFDKKFDVNSSVCRTV
jgi:hypothetical protein